MQCISSQITDGICIFTFRRIDPILTEIKLLPQSFRIIEFAELEGTPQDHLVQLLV